MTRVSHSPPSRNACALRLALVSVVFSLLGASACVDTGTESIDVPLEFAGEASPEPFAGRDAVMLTLEEADLAFGPLYLCAGAQAGDLCSTAKLEWLEGGLVDALDPEPTPLGELHGIAGEVRSAMYDLGLTSLLTQETPLELPAAQDLGGASVRISGTVSLEGIALPFEAAVPIQQDEQTEAGIPVVRTSAGSFAPHEVREDSQGLRVSVSPRSWVTDIDFMALLEDRPCAEQGPAFVCAGQIEQTCNPDGSTEQARDCGDLAQVCVAGLGCVDHMEFDADSQAARSIRTRIIAQAPAEFSWEDTYE